MLQTDKDMFWFRTVGELSVLQLASVALLLPAEETSQVSTALSPSLPLSLGFMRQAPSLLGFS